MLNEVFFSLINKSLSSNQQALNMLTTYKNKIFIISTLNVFSFKAKINHDGYLLPLTNDDDFDGDFDTIIAIPLSIILPFIKNDYTTVIQLLEIKGNKNFAIDLLHIISNLDIIGSIYDHIPIKSSLGLQILIKLFMLIKKTSHQIISNTKNSLYEYVKYEQNNIKNIKN